MTTIKWDLPGLPKKPLVAGIAGFNDKFFNGHEQLDP